MIDNWKQNDSTNNPTNCVGASLALLGAITEKEFENETILRNTYKNGRSPEGVKKYLQTKYGEQIYLKKYSKDHFAKIVSDLTLGYATALFIEFKEPIKINGNNISGHLVVLAKYENELYVFDPQQNSWYTNEHINEYFNTMGASDFHVFYVTVLTKRKIEENTIRKKKEKTTTNKKRKIENTKKRKINTGLNIRKKKTTSQTKKRQRPNTKSSSTISKLAD
jgi:hypothetical protein